MHLALQTRIVLALALGITAAAGNLLGALFVVRGDWSHRFLTYFVALGAGFMLAVSLLDMIPESLRLSPAAALPLVVTGYFLVHLFEHTIAPHFHFGEEIHKAEMRTQHASFSALLGLAMHSFFDGVAIASGFVVASGLGLLIFLAIMLHKLPEGFTVSSLLLAGGKSRKSAFGGAIWLGASTIAGVVLLGIVRTAVAYTLPISAGVTLYVAASDLIPEVNREPGPGIALLVFLGLALLFALQKLFHL